MSLRSFFYAVYTAYTFVHLTAADPPAYYGDHNYELGKYGAYPTIHFETTSFVAPRINFNQWDDECADDGLFFLAIRSESVDHVGPTILDQEGHMIWHREETDLIFQRSYNLKVQRYKGEDVLTFWAGEDITVGHGAGYYYIYDNNYRLIKKVGAVGHNLMGDLHEFMITDDDTAILTSYATTPFDLSQHWPAKARDSLVFDGVFQEINLDTFEVIFEWRSLEHVPVNLTHFVPTNAGTKENPFDYFHINSVDKDTNGDYLVSGRYTNSILKIDGRTGQVKWHLGGKVNSFRDVSNGAATTFTWQHDARWHDDGKTMTLFNNADHQHFLGEAPEGYAAGLRLGIDERAMTVELLASFQHPAKYTSESQGSLQMLENGNAFIGWGSTAAFTEFRPDGSVACDVHYAPLYTRGGNFSSGAVVSYRAFKQAWVGIPFENPRVAFREHKAQGRESGAWIEHMSDFFVSWNGATTARSWKFEGSHEVSERQEWHHINTFRKSGFESNITFNMGWLTTFRLTALDDKGGEIRAWIVQHPDIVQIWSTGSERGSRFLEGAAILLGGFLVYKLVFRRGGLSHFLRRRSLSNHQYR